MSDSEFDVIKKYFSFPDTRPDVLLAAGDDCAMVSVPAGKQLLVTTDTLISGVHFPEKTSAEDIAYKSIMVNLSDLAAMGATPAWLTLAISLPGINESWLSAFSKQFSAVLSEFSIALIGGDTTKGALSITIQAMGLCESKRILRRNQATVNDKIFVTGDLGSAAIGLHAILNDISDDALSPCIDKLNRPQARVRFAEHLSPYSSCAIDISDGLAADLGHIINASQCGANIKLAQIPLSTSTQYYFERYCKNNIDWSMVLTQGDDYELCFTVKNEDVPGVKALAKKHQLAITCIGEITDSSGVAFVNEAGDLNHFSNTGFKHF